MAKMFQVKHTEEQWVISACEKCWDEISCIEEFTAAQLPKSTEQVCYFTDCKNSK